MINKKESVMTLSLCGDIFISKRLPIQPYSGFEQIQQLLQQHECRFANLETTVHTPLKWIGLVFPQRVSDNVSILT